jgi:hypothetical protein
MSNTLHCLRTGDECSPALTDLLLDADTALWLAQHDKTVRHLYVVAPLPTPRYRPAPEHGAYPATMLRQKRGLFLSLVYFAAWVLVLFAGWLALAGLLWLVMRALDWMGV